MTRYIDAELIEKYISREEHNTPDEKWRPESEFAALVDNIPTADVVEVVRCTECAMHSKCIMEDTFIAANLNVENMNFAEDAKRQVIDEKTALIKAGEQE